MYTLKKLLQLDLTFSGSNFVNGALYNPGELSILTINFLVSLGNRPGKSQKLSITSRRSTKLNNAARVLIRPIGNLLIKRFAHHNMKYL